MKNIRVFSLVLNSGPDNGDCISFTYISMELTINVREGFRDEATITVGLSGVRRIHALCEAILKPWEPER